MSRTFRLSFDDVTQPTHISHGDYGDSVGRFARSRDITHLCTGGKPTAIRNVALPAVARLSGTGERGSTLLLDQQHFLSLGTLNRQHITTSSEAGSRSLNRTRSYSGHSCRRSDDSFDRARAWTIRAHRVTGRESKRSKLQRKCWKSGWPRA